MAMLINTKRLCFKCGQRFAWGSDRCVDVDCPIGAANWEEIQKHYDYLGRMAYGSYREHADANNPNHIAEMGW